VCLPRRIVLVFRGALMSVELLYAGQSMGPRLGFLSVVAIAFGLVAANSALADRTTGELRVRERTIDTGAVYIEGAYQYVTVRRTSDRRVVHRRRSANGLSARLRLPPGYYRVESWTRSCVGTCEQLDPPSGRCRGSFRVRGGRYVTGTIHSGVGIRCRITNP